jgi:hypothetical protein
MYVLESYEKIPMRQCLRTLCVFTSLIVVSVVAPMGAVGAAPATGASAAPASKSAEPPKVDPEAVKALYKMGTYLRSLESFEIQSRTTTEDVLDNDQKVQIGGAMDYKVHKPGAFQITDSTDRKVRQYYFDGKNFTIYAPKMNFYSTVAAPPTITELFKRAYDKYGIEFPLEDLFHWGSADNRFDDLVSASVVGYAKIDGQDSDQFAYRQGDADWQIWIQRGDKPLPLKLVIVKTSDETMPEYTAVLHWNTSATFPDDTFTFKPPASAKAIALKPAQS